MKANSKNSSTKSTAIYCRLARKNNKRIAIQKERVLHYASEQGYSDISLYIDNGASGLNLNRPGFMKLNEDINNGKINTVLIQSISRIGRGYIETSLWIESMTEKGVSVKAIDGSIGHSDHEVCNMLNKFAQYYSRNSAKKGGR